MREIKFRAWDGKLMHTVSGLSWMQGGLIFYGPGVGEGICEAHPKFDWKADTVLMQYTGLKDKNGSEIFEGDVVDIDGCKNRVVEWDEDWCGFYLSRELNPVGYFLSEEYEIIGNIYENPELLNT